MTAKSSRFTSKMIRKSKDNKSATFLKHLSISFNNFLFSAIWSVFYNPLKTTQWTSSISNRWAISKHLKLSYPLTKLYVSYLMLKPITKYGNYHCKEHLIINTDTDTLKSFEKKCAEPKTEFAHIYEGNSAFFGDSASPEWEII